MIEHLTIRVEDLEEARGFYEALLAPLGYEVTRRLPDHDDGARVAFGRDRRAQLWLVEGGIAHEGMVIALAAGDEGAVDAFRSTAEDAGADDVRDAEAGDDGRYRASAKDASGNRIVAVAGGEPRGMFDHVQMVVSDFGRTLRFYEALLEPLGVAMTKRELDHADGPRVAFGQGAETALWLTEEGDPVSDVVIGFSAAGKRAVDEFHTIAVETGARGRSEPAVRAEVGPSYYVSGAIDPDNNRLEAVHDGEHGLAPAAAAPEGVGGDKLADAAELARWEAERAQAKAAEMAEADKRSGRSFAALSTAPVSFVEPPAGAKKQAAAADDEEASEIEDEEEDAFDLASLGLDDDEETTAAASEDEDEPFDFASLGLDDDEEETPAAAASEEDDEPFDFASLGLDDDDEETPAAVASEDDDEPFDFASLGLDDDEEETGTEAKADDEDFDLASLGLDDDEPEERPKKAAQPAKKDIAAGLGMDFGGKL